MIKRSDHHDHRVHVEPRIHQERILIRPLATKERLSVREFSFSVTGGPALLQEIFSGAAPNGPGRKLLKKGCAGLRLMPSYRDVKRQPVC